jgi:hypothetical protein
MSRSLALLLITVLVLSSLVVVGSVFAQSVPAPSTPTFTLKSIGRYMDGLMNNSHIRVTIDNQLLPANLGDGKYSIYYSIRFKPHSSPNFYGPIGHLMTIDNSLSPDPNEAQITEELYNAIPAQSNSSKTTYTLVISENFNPDADDQIDVQVKAIIGHNFSRWIQHYAIDHYYAGIPRYNDTKVLFSYQDVTQDSESNWSDTQTVSIEEVQTPSLEPAISQEPVLILGIVAFVAVFAFGLVLLYRIRSKKGS